MTSDNRPVNWPAEAILTKLDALSEKVNTIYIVMLGVPSTEDKGLLGSVKGSWEQIKLLQDSGSQIDGRLRVIEDRCLGDNNCPQPTRRHKYAEQSIIGTICLMVGSLITILGKSKGWW